MIGLTHKKDDRSSGENHIGTSLVGIDLISTIRQISERRSTFRSIMAYSFLDVKMAFDNAIDNEFSILVFVCEQPKLSSCLLAVFRPSLPQTLVFIKTASYTISFDVECESDIKLREEDSS